MRLWLLALLLLAAIPASADSRFRIAIMVRPELAPGKGQCDIRLEIDNDAQITIRRDLVLVHPLSGEDARDDGSECNVPLRAGEMRNFALQPIDNRSEINVLERPTARNDYAVILRIVDSAAGFGRYHFRLSWDAPTAPTAAETPRKSRKQSDTDRPEAPEGFVWNNAVTYKGRGSGEAVLNDGAAQRLVEARADVDLGGKVVVSFTQDQPRGAHGSPRKLVFTGSVMSREGSRIRADMVTEDHRLHGTMTLSVDASNNVNSIIMNATDGQDHLRLSWDRR